MRTLKIIGITVFVVQCAIITSAFCEGSSGTSSTPQGIEQSADLKRFIRQKEQNAINLARQALAISDSYDDLKTSVKTKQEEIEKVNKRKAALQTILQRTKAEFNKKLSEFAGNSQMQDIIKKLYISKINELKVEQELIEKSLPTLNMELSQEKIELQANEIVHAQEKDATSENIDLEFERAVMERFQKSEQILNSINLYKP